MEQYLVIIILIPALSSLPSLHIYCIHVTVMDFPRKIIGFRLEKKNLPRKKNYLKFKFYK